jgi:predicted TPR repeat methyltransferase
VYDLATQADTDAYYTRWAASYDDELTRQGYQTPRRCADALRRLVASDASVLDIGCGTGLSGAALAAAGFTNLAGTDVNAEMLDVARVAGIYRDTWVTDIEDPFPFTDALTDVVSSGLAEQEFTEHGIHIKGLGSMSTVFVLRRC